MAFKAWKNYVLHNNIRMGDIVKGIKHINGQEVYSNEYAQKIREENDARSRAMLPIFNFIPQEGFQEQVLTQECDIQMIGGRRGGGKSAIMIFSPLYNINNPLFRSYGFRKEENDVREGLANTARIIYGNTAKSTDKDFKWEFKSGATVLFNHLANENEIDRRFRGQELPSILIDEVTQMQEKTVFTLLASNRNTIGVRNSFIMSCNPERDRKKWGYKIVKWYINEDTGEVRQDRNGVVRYFFKHGKSVDDITWGDTKEEVYRKAKSKIDAFIDPASGITYKSLINSFCFIEGKYSENKILQNKDKKYMGNLASKGDEDSKADILGLWGMGGDEQSSEISEDEIRTHIFDNTPQRTGTMYATIDVALNRDFFVIYIFDGRHIVDIECFAGVLSDDAVQVVRKVLDKYNIREENMAYDGNGIGRYLEGNFRKAIMFNNKATASNPKLWDNKKSECAENFVTNVKRGKYSVDEKVLEKKIFMDTQVGHSRSKGMSEYTLTWSDRILAESHALCRKVGSDQRFEIITKMMMKILVGHSPDFLEALFMREVFPDKARRFSGLGML